MAMYEYQVIRGVAEHLLPDKLNSEGKVGWRVVHFAISRTDNLPIAVLERELRTSSEEAWIPESRRAHQAKKKGKD